MNISLVNTMYSMGGDPDQLVSIVDILSTGDKLDLRELEYNIRNLLLIYNRHMRLRNSSPGDTSGNQRRLGLMKSWMQGDISYELLNNKLIVTLTL